jgi:hypothetical protein
MISKMVCYKSIWCIPLNYAIVQNDEVALISVLLININNNIVLNNLAY